MPTLEEIKQMLESAAKWWEEGGSLSELSELPEDEADELHFD